MNTALAGLENSNPIPETFPSSLVRVSVTGLLKSGEEIKQDFEIKLPRNLPNYDTAANAILQNLGGINIKKGDEYTFYPMSNLDKIVIRFNSVVGVTI